MSNVVALHTIPLTIEHARELIGKVRSVDEAKAIADKAVALATYVRVRKAGQEAELDAAEIVIRARARIGELLAELEHDDPRSAGRKGGRGRKRGEVAPELSPRARAIESAGLSRDDVRVCLKLASVPIETLERHVAGVRARAERLTTSGTIAAVSHGGEYDSDQWYTPPEIIADARRVLGDIDLDPASCKVAQRTVRAHKFYTADDDGLAHAWKGRVWLNPPFSQPLCGRFVDKFIAEAASGRMTKGILLLNASTDTAWWHALASRFPMCFTKGRLAFLDESGQPVNGNRVGQVIFAHGCGRTFATVFAAHGLVLQAA